MTDGIKNETFFQDLVKTMVDRANTVTFRKEELAALLPDALQPAIDGFEKAKGFLEQADANKTALDALDKDMQNILAFSAEVKGKVDGAATPDAIAVDLGRATKSFRSLPQHALNAVSTALGKIEKVTPKFEFDGMGNPTGIEEKTLAALQKLDLAVQGVTALNEAIPQTQNARDTVLPKKAAALGDTEISEGDTFLEKLGKEMASLNKRRGYRETRLDRSQVAEFNTLAEGLSEKLQEVQEKLGLNIGPLKDVVDQLKDAKGKSFTLSAEQVQTLMSAEEFSAKGIQQFANVYNEGKTTIREALAKGDAGIAEMQEGLAKMGKAGEGAEALRDAVELILKIQKNVIDPAISKGGGVSK